MAAIVAGYWLEQVTHPQVADLPVMCRQAAHPLAMVLTALAGETDPARLGLPPGSLVARQVAVAVRAAEVGDGPGSAAPGR